LLGRKIVQTLYLDIQTMMTAPKTMKGQLHCLKVYLGGLLKQQLSIKWSKTNRQITANYFGAGKRPTSYDKTSKDTGTKMQC
jgi:hypothetical protein